MLLALRYLRDVLWVRLVLLQSPKAAEFVRVIFADETTEVAAGGGYYCQTCWTQPKYDFHWTKARKCGSLSGWFCAAKGHAYDKAAWLD